MTTATIERYVFAIDSGSRVIIIENDNGDILSQIWKLPLLLKCHPPFFLFEIIDSDNPMAGLANSIFDFLKRGFRWNDPTGQTIIYRGPEIPEAFQQVDKFIEECCRNTSFMVQLLFEICGGFPHTLLFGIHLPESFFENTSLRNTFLRFLAEMSSQRIDLRIYVSSSKNKAELGGLIESAKLLSDGTQ